MNFKSLVSSLLICFFVIGNVNASEISQSEVVTSEALSVASEQDSEISSVESEQESEIIIVSEVDSSEDPSNKVEVETRGSGYGPNDPIPTTYNGEKLITYYKDYKRYRAELFYTSGEKHADYTYNDKSWVTYTEYYKNGNKKSYQSRYDNLKMKEKAEYHTNGKTKKMYNYYDNGRKSMYRTWNDQGIKTNQIQYYNQANSMKSVDYAYYSNGKVSEYIKRFSNGKTKERVWYHENGRIRRMDNYYSTGRRSMFRTWDTYGIKTDQREYYNMANGQIKANYDYFVYGETKGHIKWRTNGKRIEYVLRHGSGEVKHQIKYNSKGKVISDKKYVNKEPYYDTEFSQELFVALNNHRANKGLDPYYYDYSLQPCADLSSFVLATEGWGHINFQRRPEECANSWAENETATNLGESAKSIIGRFADSPGHEAAQTSTSFETVAIGVFVTPGGTRCIEVNFGYLN